MTTGERAAAAAWVLQRLDEHGEDDVAREYVARAEATGVSLAGYVSQGHLAHLTRARVDRPPGIYVPVVLQPPGVARRDHTLSAALLVGIGRRGETPLGWRHAELGDEVARRFHEVTGFRLGHRLVLGSEALRASLMVDDLRSAEAGMLLHALLELEARFNHRSDGPGLGARRVVVTGNLLNPGSPEGQDVVVGRVDAGSLGAKLAAAFAALTPEDLIIVPAGNEAPGWGSGPMVRSAATASDLVAALTPGATLRSPPSWSLEQRAVALRERVLGEDLTPERLNAVAESAMRLRAITPAHEPEVAATLEAVLAAVSLRLGRAEEADVRVEPYVPGDHTFENYGPELRSHLILLRSEVMAAAGDLDLALAELDKAAAQHIPEREEHLIEVARLRLLLRQLEGGSGSAESAHRAWAALRLAEEFPHADRATLSGCRARLVTATSE